MLTRIRTGHSFRTSVGQIDKVLDRVQKAWPNRRHIPITDRASTYGWSEFLDECGKRNLNAVLGVELEVSPDITAKKPVSDLWVFLPNGKEFSNDSQMFKLNKLITLAYKQFRYRPLLTIEQALNNPCIKIMGHRFAWWDDHWEDIRDEYSASQNILAGLSPSVTPYYYDKVDGLIPWVCSGDNFYPNKHDKSLFQSICFREGGAQTYPTHIMSLNEYRYQILTKFAGRMTEDYFNKILTQSENLLKDASSVRPVKAELPEYENELSLIKKCMFAFNELNIPPTDEYIQRLEHELKIIGQKNFDKYFHIVGDLVQWARKRMIVGPGRGSAAGSLVCYLLGITEVDPIKHGLSFERFIDIHREDLPDIDIDFPKDERIHVIRRLQKLFGRNKAVQLGTVHTYQAKQSLKEGCAALGIRQWDLGSIKNSEDLSADLNDSDILAEFPELELLLEMEGHPRNSGKHAAAVVLSNRNILYTTSVNLRDPRSPVAMMSKKPAEKIGLLKIDVLGLKTLDVLKECMRLAGVDFRLLNKFHLQYKPAYDIINQGKFTGIFQFDGDSAQAICRKVEVEKFSDLCVITSLTRPGVDDDPWVKRRLGIDPVSYYGDGKHDDLFEPILGETLGVLVYQEQMMRIMREVGDMKWSSIMKLRKAINDKDTEIFEEYRDEFIDGCVQKNSLQNQLANDIYDDLMQHGNYSFNKSHAVSYSLLSYWCMLLKSKFPLEFTAASLTYIGGASKDIILNKQRTLLKDMIALGAEYVPVDIEHSIDKWVINDNKLIGPLQNIHGISTKSVKTILKCRLLGDPIPDGIMKKLIRGNADLQSLNPIQDTIANLKANIITKRITTQNLNTVYAEEEVCLICCIDKIVSKKDKYGRTRLVLHVHDDDGKIYATVNNFYLDRVNNIIKINGIKDKYTKKQNIYALKGKVYNPDREGEVFNLGVQAVKYLGNVI